MKRPTLRLLLTLSLLGLGWSSAQPLLESYDRATAALRSSSAAFPDDQVGSLDALRNAETAFETLGSAFEPGLKQGLSETFDRAEAAIVNGSKTDLEVQTAVLRGGFQRAIYEQALRDAGDDRLPRAQALLNVLGRDLALSEPTFTGSSRQILQSTFETRLAALSITQLDTLGGDLENRYQTLAQLYSYVFLVQDSPRLPPETRSTVLATIRSLIAEEPIDDTLGLLRAQLEAFARSAAAAGDPAPAALTEPTATDTTATDATATAAPSTATGAQTVASTAQPTEPPVAGTGSQTDIALPGLEQPGAPRGAVTQPNPASTLTGAGVSTPAAPTTATQRPGWSSLLETPLPTVLLIGAGLLALLGILRLLAGLPRSSSRWRDLALCLLLFPAAGQGLITLAVTLVPFFDQPLLAQAATYSLFSYPLSQLVWGYLTIVAVLCSLPRNRNRATGTATAPTASATKIVAPTPSAPPRSAPVMVSKLNWDEDF